MAGNAMASLLLALLVAVPGTAVLATGSAQEYQVTVGAGSENTVAAGEAQTVRFGSLLIMGDGEVQLRGNMCLTLFASGAAVVTVTSHVWVRAFGSWSVESAGDNVTTYRGSGALELVGWRAEVQVSGSGLSLKVSGRGSASVGKGLSYWSAGVGPQYHRNLPGCDNEGRGGGVIRGFRDRWPARGGCLIPPAGFECPP